ncbi:hypothetical protein C1J00_18630 [Streptomyces cahuitamycinicus]|uniref:Hemerythrin-like domain-containing protein n=1 Tax=Streptomyces cahuitamycinicus TaxID=2070367 RepID=A0A2N8TP24_9ACTN|nr:hypothetical protein C1J00_18630 [Streptomyces cahuitamycinicus]
MRNLFDEVEKTTGGERRAAFRRLVRLLAVHETAEEEVIHPFTRRAGPGGEKVVDERLREEREARELLSCLDGMDTDGPKFPPEPQVRLGASFRRASTSLTRPETLSHANCKDPGHEQCHGRAGRLLKQAERGVLTPSRSARR